jgi:hypothetical protein
LSRRATERSGIALVEPIKQPGVLARFGAWYARRRFGQVPEPPLIAACR